MNKILNALKFVWKNNKLWLFITCLTLIIVFTVTIVATQNTMISNTLSTLMGGPRRVLVSGDPTKYEYYTADTDDFMYYEPTNLNYTGKSLFAFDNSSKQAKTDTYNEANRLNEKIVEEGIVLLKNDNALPFATSAQSKKKVSIFGKNSANLVYGGSGSGGGKTDGASTISDSLKAANFDVNPTLASFYEKNSQSGSGRGSNPSMGVTVTGLAIGETPQNLYTTDVKNSYKNTYNDIAVVVLSRVGGEGFDLPRTMVDSNGNAISGADAGAHYLQLDNNEKALLSEVASVGFGKIIVVINCSTSMELKFLDDEQYKIDGALWLGSPGYSGVMALGRVLSGEVNPSGRLVDTYSKDFMKDPAMQNFSYNGEPGSKTAPAGNEYRNSSGKGFGEFYVEYAEGIYVGYRYYETRAYEIGGTAGEEWYNENVLYSFGYGLSYTNFKWEIKSWTNMHDDGPSSANTLTKNGKIIVEVEVTNDGTRPGKDVVQLYYNAPYYDTDINKIEKAHVVLGAFAKTDEIAVGQSDTVTLELKVSDMASYDYNGNGRGYQSLNTYKLDPGSYSIFIGDDAHNAWNDSSDRASLASRRKSFTVPSAGNGFVYNEGVAEGTAVNNRFTEENTYMTEKVSQLARDSFFSTRQDIVAPLKAPANGREASQTWINSLKYSGKDNANDPWYVAPENMPEHSKDTQDDDPMLWDMIKFDEDGNTVLAGYEDPRWDNMIKRLTPNEMAYLIGTGNFNSARIEKIGKPRTTDPDGPAGFTNFMGDPTVYETCYYASECVIAATWNKLLAHDMGVMVGLEGLWGNQKGDGRSYNGWYAPAMNIHRTPFSGRNFEYYSEDPYFSGIMGANVIQGAKTKGVYTYVKHFAVNDQETNRNGICTWATEQALREIYLKPFEIAVKVGQATGVMSSFNRFGRIWVGGDYRMLTEVLRDEWGFQGTVISDYNTESHMPADQMIRAGGDLNLIQDKQPSTSSSALTATQITAMQKATKNILYTVAGSNAMNGMGPDVVWGEDMPMWVWYLIFVNIGLAAVFAVWGFFAIRKSRKKLKRTNS